MYKAFACMVACVSYRISSVGGVKVSMVAFQAVDPGSIPGRRRFFDKMERAPPTTIIKHNKCLYNFALQSAVHAIQKYEILCTLMINCLCKQMKKYCYISLKNKQKKANISNKNKKSNKNTS